MKVTTVALATVSLVALSSAGYAQTAPANPATTTNQGNTPAEGSTDKTATPAADSNAIVVTAQRRQERVTEVPISITVANQAQLERQQVNGVNDLNRIAPSLEIQSAPGQNVGGGGTIRGLGTQTFAAGASASVGIVVDQVSQGNSNIADLFDVARIEVLKGPQGTLFGLTTSAGVINITTNAPDPNEFMVRARTQLSARGFAGSEFGDQVLQGVVNLPVSSDSALRISGLANLRQGPTHNLATDKYADVDSFALRGRYLWRPSHALTVNLIGDYNWGHSNNGGDFLTVVAEAPSTPASPNPELDVLTACGIKVRPGNHDICTTQPIHGSNRNYGGSLQVDYDAGPVVLTSITAGRWTHARGSDATILRTDNLPVQINTGASNGGANLFTEELRASSAAGARLEYTAGVFYSRQKSSADPASFGIVLNLPFGQIPILFDPGAANIVVDESKAAFGQLTYHATDRLRLIAGARITGEKLTLDRTPVGRTETFTETKVTKASWKLGAQYNLARKTMVYVTASRGFKGGQIETPTGGEPVVLRPEIPTDYEIGVKSTLFRNWVLDVNAFYTKVKDFQAQQCVVNPANGQLVCAGANISEVKARGAEVSLFGNITKNLSVSTGFIIAKTTYPSGFLGNDGSDLGGRQVAYAPRYKFTFSGEYDQPLNSSFEAFIAGDAVWKSRIWYEQKAGLATTFAPAWTTGGRIGVKTADGRFSAAVFGRNLGNTHEPQFFLSQGPTILAIYGPQSFRQVGLELDAKF